MLRIPLILYAYALLASTIVIHSESKCPEFCPLVYQPVCGTDNITYPNECNLKVADCKSDENITVMYLGPCDSSSRHQEAVGIFGLVCTA